MKNGVRTRLEEIDPVNNVVTAVRLPNLIFFFSKRFLRVCNRSPRIVTRPRPRGTRFTGFRRFGWTQATLAHEPGRGATDNDDDDAASRNDRGGRYAAI